MELASRDSWASLSATLRWTTLRWETLALGNIRLRILHAILSGGFYGSERYCIDLAIAQARAGHDVIVLVEDEASTCAEEFRHSIAQAKSAVVRLIALPRYIPPWLQRPAAAVILAVNRPAIVHTHLNPAARRIGA